MTASVLIGAVFGLGLYVLVRALVPSKRSPVATVAQIDALRARGASYGSASDRAAKDAGN
ncbi:type II secretion system protein, partial [Streptomyces sp. NPDC048845]